MERKKQIAEIGIELSNALHEHDIAWTNYIQDSKNHPKPMGEFRAMAEHLYEAGYRKQSEGCDFCKAGSEKCGTCVKFFDYHEDGGSDRCSSEYGNEKCAYYKPVHHCSNCGAKMKGGTE